MPQTHEESVLRAKGFELVRATDSRCVVTEREHALRVQTQKIQTAPHASEDEAWRAAYARVTGQ